MRRRLDQAVRDEQVFDPSDAVATIPERERGTDGALLQAKDGIRDYKVTGVQTCALPISAAIFNDDRNTEPLLQARLNQAGDDVQRSSGRCGRHQCNNAGWPIRLRMSDGRRSERSKQGSEKRRVGKEGRSRRARTY